MSLASVFRAMKNTEPAYPFLIDALELTSQRLASTKSKGAKINKDPTSGWGAIYDDDEGEYYFGLYWKVKNTAVGWIGIYCFWHWLESSDPATKESGEYQSGASIHVGPGDPGTLAYACRLEAMPKLFSEENLAKLEAWLSGQEAAFPQLGSEFTEYAEKVSTVVART